MIAVYRTTLGITTIRWLCSPCRDARARAGWSHEHIPLKVVLPWCDDCERRRQDALEAEAKLREQSPDDAREYRHRETANLAEANRGVEGIPGASVSSVSVPKRPPQRKTPEGDRDTGELPGVGSSSSRRGW